MYKNRPVNQIGMLPYILCTKEYQYIIMIISKVYDEENKSNIGACLWILMEHTDTITNVSVKHYSMKKATEIICDAIKQNESELE